MNTDGAGTRGLAADGHIARVATEGGDVLLHPVQCRALVRNAPGAAALWRQRGVGQEAKGAEAVVHRHHDEAGAR